MIDRVLAWGNLKDAWLRVADKRGAPGTDRISVRRFARNWEANLRRLRNLVRSNRYRPAKLRRLAISKRDGGQRLLGIPTVGDRVLQRAALNVLDDRFERHFLDCSYGYRIGRSLRDAVAAILEYRDRGYEWVLDADIDDCFGSLDHQLLLDFLRKEIGEGQLMSLIRSWLRVGRSSRRPDRGIPPGMPLSPLCCNVYLHRLDEALARGRWATVRYADDILVLCRSRAQVEQAADFVAEELDKLNLRLEPHKTHLTAFCDGFDYLGVRFERDNYSFLWQQKRFEVEGPTPRWLWGYVPDGYDD